MARGRLGGFVKSPVKIGCMVHRRDSSSCLQDRLSLCHREMRQSYVLEDVTSRDSSTQNSRRMQKDARDDKMCDTTHPNLRNPLEMQNILANTPGGKSRSTC